MLSAASGTGRDGQDADGAAPRLVGALRPAIDAVARINAGVSRKLFAGFLASALLLLVMGALNLAIIARMDGRVEDILRAQQKVHAADGMKYDVTSQMHYRAMTLLMGDNSYLPKIVTAKAEFQSYLAMIEGLSPPSQQPFYATVRADAARFDASSARVLALYKGGHIDAATRLHLSQEHPLSHVLEAEMRQLERVFGSETTTARDAYAGDRGLLTGLVGVFSLVSVGMALLLGFLLSWSFILPVRKINGALAAIAAGNFARRVMAPNRDEFGALSSNLNITSERLQTLYDTLAQKNEEINQLNSRLQADNVRMRAELDVTRRLQQMVLPRQTELEQTPGLQIAAYMQAATEVGGDYYDVLPGPDGATTIGIGDVTGHGLESGVLMLMVQMGVRTLLEADERDPDRFLDVLNRAVWGNVQRMGSDKNLTLALLDYKDGRLRLTGQHESLLLARQGRPVEVVDTIDLGFPVGLVEDIAAFVAHVDLALSAGDVVVLYSDGIVEAPDAHGAQYGLERLCGVLEARRGEAAERIKEAILADVAGHVGLLEPDDDITLVVLVRQG